jgi:hypothetical protein
VNGEAAQPVQTWETRQQKLWESALAVLPLQPLQPGLEMAVEFQMEGYKPKLWKLV